MLASHLDDLVFSVICWHNAFEQFAHFPSWKETWTYPCSCETTVSGVSERSVGSGMPLCHVNECDTPDFMLSIILLFPPVRSVPTFSLVLFFEPLRQRRGLVVDERSQICLPESAWVGKLNGDVS